MKKLWKIFLIILFLIFIFSQFNFVFWYFYKFYTYLICLKCLKILLHIFKFWKNYRMIQWYCDIYWWLYFIFVSEFTIFLLFFLFYPFILNFKNSFWLLKIPKIFIKVFGPISDFSMVLFFISWLIWILLIFSPLFF